MNAIKLLYHFAVWPFESKVFKTNRIHSFYSKRYGKWITVPIGFKCDGSTWSPNIGWSWLFHDWLFAKGKFDDGTPCKWRQANMIMRDVMTDEGQFKWVKKLYQKGIKSKWSYKAWRKHRKKTVNERIFSNSKVPRYRFYGF